MTGRTRNKLREARATKTKHGEIWQSIKKPSTQSNELRVRIAKLRLQVAQVIAHLGFNESSLKDTDCHSEACAVTKTRRSAQGGVAPALINNPKTAAGDGIINSNTAMQIGVKAIREVGPLG